MKRIISLLLALSLLTAVFALSAASVNAAEECPDYVGSNANAQDYYNWSSPSGSYLTIDGNYLVRFQADAFKKQYGVAYFDADYKLVKHIYVQKELPLFGAFFSDGQNYYILSGQNNPDESDEVEVYRITKYDKSWNKLGSAGLYGANTYAPFDAGSARIETSGKYLLIRTCHEMYKSSDGYHHQANVMIQFDKENIEITDSFYGVMNSSAGYVSHSFNQFVRAENNKMITVDHGDAYPRSVVLIEYPNDIDSGRFRSYGCKVTDLLGFVGNVGNNYTGASVGGFEISGTSYLTAINSINQSDFENSETRNISVIVKPKDSETASVKQITSYAEGTESASTPQLVKISDSRFMLMWSRNGKVYYTELDSSGNNGKIYSMTADLSDCQPVITDGKLVWYVWNNEANTFNEIKLSDISKSSSHSVSIGHKYKWTNATASDRTVTKQCSVCGKKLTYRSPDSLTMFFSTSSAGSFWSAIELSYTTKQKIYVLGTYDGGDSEVQDFGVKISDSSVLSYNPSDKVLIPKNEGIAEVTFYLTHRPSVRHSYKFVIENSHKTVLKYEKAATYFENGYTGDCVCTICGDTKKYGRTIAKLRLDTPTVTVKAAKRTLTVRYKRVRDASGFQVRYVLKGKAKIKTFAAKKSVSKTISKLAKGSYKINVRAYIKKGTKTAYSSWTKAKTVKIK